MTEELFSATLEDSTLSLAGELDVSAAPEAEELFGRACARGGTITVDLGGLTFIDSTGLAVLLRARRQADNDGCTLQLVNVPDPCARLFELTGTREYLERGEGG